jgi:glycerol uptake facilitator-like aquaporin
MAPLGKRAFSEWLGTAFLLAAVVGSGIMAQKLSGGNAALALLCNTLPTGAILVVLILTFGPLSGAHLNPAVSLAFSLRGELPWSIAAVYIAAQVVGGIVGVWAAHLMFELPPWQLSMTVRTGPGQWLAEAVATFGLLLTIFGCVARTPAAVPYAVGLYITAAYWYRVHVLRESGRDDRARTFRYVRGHCSCRRRGLYRGAARRYARGRRRGAMAVEEVAQISALEAPQTRGPV